MSGIDLNSPLVGLCFIGAIATGVCLPLLWRIETSLRRLADAAEAAEKRKAKNAERADRMWAEHRR